MKYSQIHKRYATALFELATEMKVVDAVGEDMKTLHVLATESKELKLILKSPIIKSHVKDKVLSSLF
ncbi:MAG: hypothetical protein C0592_12985 [Marinilabiliales bacterium]|nr:MAG: hypothetical protein C0592_12985 [Marinilabiliales bacterium]